MRRRKLILIILGLLIIILTTYCMLYGGFYNNSILVGGHTANTFTNTYTTTTITINREQLVKKIILYNKDDVIKRARIFCKKLNLECNIYIASIDNHTLEKFLSRITKQSPYEELPPTSVIYIVGFRDKHNKTYTLGVSAYTGLPYVYTNWSAVDLGGEEVTDQACYAKYVMDKNMLYYIKNVTLRVLHAMGYDIIEDIILSRDLFTGRPLIYSSGSECMIDFIPIVKGLQAIPSEYLYSYEPYLNGIEVKVDVLYSQNIIENVKISGMFTAIVDQFSKVNSYTTISRGEALSILKEWIQSNLSNNVYYKVVSYHVVDATLGFAIEYKHVNYTFIFKLKLFWVIPTIVLDENGGEHKYIILVDAESGEVKRA